MATPIAQLIVIQALAPSVITRSPTQGDTCRKSTLSARAVLIFVLFLGMGSVGTQEILATNTGAPRIISLQTSFVVAPGQQAVLRVEAEGTDLRYRWYRGPSGETHSP